jgi:hypothetical protein
LVRVPLPLKSPLRVIVGSGILVSLLQSTDVIVALLWLCESSATVVVIVTLPKLVKVPLPLKSPLRVIVGSGILVSFDQSKSLIC